MQNDSLQAIVVAALLSKNKTLSTAESCTGGLLCAAITSVSGASAVLEIGICTYSNNAKIKLINVQEETLDKFGAVSTQTAAQMAQGVKRLANADFGVGITGIAGPTGGSKLKPVGLVYIAVSCEQGTFVQKLLCENVPRDVVRKKSVETALLMLHSLLENQSLPQEVTFYD